MAVHKSFNSAFKALYRKINSVKSSLPTVLANEGTKFFVSSFNNQGFTDRTFKSWKPRKLKDKKGTRKILVKTGRLRRVVNNSVTEKSFKRIVWRVNDSEVPYAKFNNYGTNKLPQREFMGASVTLNKKLRDKITNAFKSIK